LFNFLSKAQIVKEWYFFNGYNADISNSYGIRGNNITSHDSLLFGYINEASYNSVFYVYKATHRQGLIKRTKFNYALSTNYAVDMCIDTARKFIYYLTQTGIRPPLNKYSQGMVYKLDYELNKLDSSVISYGTIFTPTKILCKNNKVYVVGGYANYFSEPIRIVVGVLNAVNLNVLNIKNVTGNDNSRFSPNMLFDNDNHLRIFLRQAGNSTGALSYSVLRVDTNLNKIDSICALNICNHGVYESVVNDNNGLTYLAYYYKSSLPPPYNQPSNGIQSYIIKTDSNDDTLKTSYFFNSYNANLSIFNCDNISSLFKLKNNAYLAGGTKYSPTNTYTYTTYYYIDSNLTIKWFFNVPNVAGRPCNMGEVGQTSNGTYYTAYSSQDTSIVKQKNSSNSYYSIFFLRTIDSTAAIISTPNPTLTPSVPDMNWENVTVYPNPTDDILNIGLPLGNTYNLNVYNNLGQSLLNLERLDNNRQVSLANMPIGVYHFVFYQTELKKSVTKKVIVQR
jgi:hypothetical protein